MDGDTGGVMKAAACQRSTRIRPAFRISFNSRRAVAFAHQHFGRFMLKSADFFYRFDARP